MKRNLGLGDAMVRLTVGFVLFGKSLHCRHNSLLMLIGAMEIASGITRFCPLYHLLGINTGGRGLKMMH